MDDPISQPQSWQFEDSWLEDNPFPTPAAGVASINLRAIPGDSWEQLESLRMLYVADGTVANRLVSVRYMDATSGGKINYEAITPINMVASSSNVLQFGVDEIPLTAVAQSNLRVRLPRMILPPGWLIRVQFQSVQVGDQASSIFFRLRRWKSARRPW